jgi:hypothetical protein
MRIEEYSSPQMEMRRSHGRFKGRTHHLVLICAARHLDTDEVGSAGRQTLTTLLTTRATFEVQPLACGRPMGLPVRI